MRTTRDRKTWVFTGGKIPDEVCKELLARIERHVAANWRGRVKEVTVQCRGKFAYIDAIAANPWMPPGLTEEEKDRVLNTPTHLCRLTYAGSVNVWEFAFYKYSDEKYEKSYLPSGSFFGTPEEALDISAGVYMPG